MKKLQKLNLKQLNNSPELFNKVDPAIFIGGCGGSGDALSIALGLIGTCQWDPGSNPTIVSMLQTCSNLTPTEQSDDGTAWCSAFVNYCYTSAGLSGTDHALASSWENWGSSTSYPQPGDVAVLYTHHHVGIVESVDGDNVTLISGNVGDCVTRETYCKDDLILRTGM